MSDEIKNKIINLTKLLNQWNYEYYALDNPSVDDYTYDQNMRTLIQLEQEYPQYKQVDSPTSRVGGIVLEKFEKVKHVRAMLSLDNIFDEQGVIKFCNDINKEVGNKSELNYVVEPKIDGLSISIFYENCKLKYACTRGDGEYGEVVTNNILTIDEIPLYINEKYKYEIIEVRGEVYMSKQALLALNKESEKQFANARNAAAGALRNLNSSITKSRHLQAFFYYAFSNKPETAFNEQYQVIEWLRENKFPTAQIIKKCDNAQQIWEHIQTIHNLRHELAYDIDGAVIKLNQRQYYDEIGYTAKFPKWAIAYKFPPEVATTKLLEIKTDVGRTGKINFIAKLNPVSLSGSIISSATLHNLEFIHDKDIHINDYVNIYKAGDVIPYVDSVNLNKRTNEIKPYKFDYLCPSCHQTVTKIDDGIDFYCLNNDCKEKRLRTIEYFVSKDVMDIEGISYSIIKKLYDHHLINNQWDLYDLKNHYDDIMHANIQIKDKLYQKMIEAIEKSKANSLERLIASFNIKNVGITVALSLAKKYQTLACFLQTNLAELLQIDIIGEKIAKSIIDFINDSQTSNLVQKIHEIGINTNYLANVNFANYDDYAIIANKQENAQYKKKNVVITGSFSIPRHEIQRILETLYDCKILQTVNKKTDYVLAGNDCGSKLDKAKTLNIRIVTNEFWK